MSPFGATILDASGTSLTREEKDFFARANPFGFILFARNIDTPDQVRALCAEMRATVGRDAPITVDQEGGRVQRLGPPHWRQWTPPLACVEAAGADAARAMYLRYRIIAADLHDLGIYSNCAPMADIAFPQTHPFLKNRCYGTDPDTVTARARAAAEGLLAGGVLPVLKHIPGHGRATSDSHFDLPRVDATAESLAKLDFAPFRALNDLPMGMTAHLVYDAIDTAPATLSPAVIGCIRAQIGFDNLLMTDDIAMKALAGDLGDIARGALAAGCDVVLHCNGSLEDRRRVADAAGEMTDVAQVRALRALDARRVPDDVDIRALEVELQTLVGTT